MPSYRLHTDSQRETILKVIASLDLTKPWAITVEREKKQRSLSQNALMHRYFEIVANEVGDDRESVKRDFKKMFLPLVEHVSKITGEITMEPISTADLDVGPMAEFMTKIEAFMTSQLGIILPADERGR